MNKRVAWKLGLLWLAAVIALTIYLIVSLRVVSNIDQFMPKSSHHPQLRALATELERGPAATILLLNIHGGSVDEQVRISRAMQAAVKPDDSVIEFIRNGEATLDMSVMQKLQPYRYLITDQDWSATGLHQALLARLSDLRAGAGPFIGKFILSDPYLALQEYFKNALGSAGPTLTNGVWMDKEVGALLMVKVKGETLDLDTMAQAMRTLKQGFANLAPAAGVQLGIAGPGAMAVATRSAIQTTIQQLSWVVVVLLIGVFWLAYRSWHLMLLASVPLLSGTLVGLGLTQLVYGEVHGVVIAFGVTLLGMCMDYPLHLFSHCRHGESAHESLRRIWPTLRLGGISSALAFLVLLGSGFDGLSQLALFAASGVLTALWVTRQLLPYWVKPEWIHPRYIKLAQHVSVRWRVLIVILGLIIPAVAWFKAKSIWENSIDAISPVPAQARQLDGTLRKAIGAPDVSHVFIVDGVSPDAALQKTEQLAEKLQPLVREKLVARIVPVTRLLPSMAAQQARQKMIPSRTELAKRLTLAVQQTPFRANAFSPFLDDAEQACTQSLLTSGALSGTALSALIRQGLIKSDSGWLSVVRLVGVSSDKALNNWLQMRPELARHHIQIKQAVSELLQSYRSAALNRVYLAFILLILLVWIAVRRVRRMLRIMLPVVLSVLASLALPLIAGHGLTVFHLLAALLVMGMGLDYSLFFNRRELLEGEWKQSMHAIGISMITTVTTFSVLAISPIPVMSAMGSVIALGILLCFVLAWMLSDATIG
jgi:predicted exporter